MSANAQRAPVFQHLQQLGIVYALTEHPAVHTIEAMRELGLDHFGEVCKNLFLRDAAGKRHFIVTIPKHKTVPLDRLRQALGTSRLGFASAERLERYLGLRQGEVTPFGVLHGPAEAVEVVFDTALQSSERLGVHPNDNTATVWLSFADLHKAVQAHGNRIHLLDLPD